MNLPTNCHLSGSPFSITNEPDWCFKMPLRMYILFIKQLVILIQCIMKDGCITKHGLQGRVPNIIQAWWWIAQGSYHVLRCRGCSSSWILVPWPKGRVLHVLSRHRSCKKIHWKLYLFGPLSKLGRSASAALMSSTDLRLILSHGFKHSSLSPPKRCLPSPHASQISVVSYTALSRAVLRTLKWAS